MYYRIVNGVKTEIQADEIAAMEDVQKEHEAAERTRHLTESEVTRMLIAQQINNLDVDDNTAMRMTDFYPEWVAGQYYAAGYKVKNNGKLWKCKEPGHTSQSGWEPSVNTASLWTEICETHDGTQYDPIPYDGNMALTAGLYYTQNGVLYICNRDTGNPVYNALAELVGLYVDVVQ